MPRIEIDTPIAAPLEVCFDLARSIDLHITSVQWTQERAIGGVRTGMLNLGEQVTWQARHLGVEWELTSQITAYDRPYFFCDEQLKGPFRRMSHRHYFTQCEGVVRMRDVFEYESPMGWLGKCADGLFLKRYIHQFLERRNNAICRIAESGQYQSFITKSEEALRI